MNIVVLLAGGVGNRLNAGIPKQFVEVLRKPLIVYSMEIYQNSNNIDALEIVSVPEYKDYIWQLAKKYHITKLKWVVDGAESCQSSTRNGLFALEGICNDDDLIMFNMSTSVFVSEDIIEDSINTAKKYGSAFACMQCIYNLAETEDGITSEKIHFKEKHKTLNLPWTSSFGKLNKMYHEAYEKDIETGQASYMPTLFLAMGEKLYMSKDTSLNKLHVTTPEDLEIVKSILKNRSEGVIKNEIFIRR